MEGIIAIIVIAVLLAAGLAAYLLFRKKASSSKTVVQPDTVSMRPDAWVISWSKNMPAHPTAAGKGWYFDFPNQDGVHYVMVPYYAVKAHTMLTMTYRVTKLSGDPKFVSVQAGGESDFRPILERQGDTMTAQSEFYRWWSYPTKLVADGLIHVLQFPLSWDRWTSVFGHTNRTEFEASMKALKGVGFTVGGDGMAGHGGYVTGGTARFELLGYEIA